MKGGAGEFRVIGLTVLCSTCIPIWFYPGEGSDQESRQRWPALESNPEILSNFLIGVGVPPAYSFVDVYGLDEDMLAMVPQVFCLHLGLIDFACL